MKENGKAKKSFVHVFLNLIFCLIHVVLCTELCKEKTQSLDVVYKTQVCGPYTPPHCLYFICSSLIISLGGGGSKELYILLYLQRFETALINHLLSFYDV